MTTKVTSLVLANTTVAPGNYGGLTQIPSLAIDAQGRVTSAANNAVSSISVATTQLTGLITTSQLTTTGVTARGYGTASQVPTFVVGADGRITSVSNTSIAIASGAVSGLAASATTDTTNASNISSGTLGSARLTGTYAISISGNAATATNANNVVSGGTIASNVTGTTQAVSVNDTTLATTAFVRSIVPAGVILMWSGSIVSIPSGWLLCNGSNGTPDLRDRFIVGAGSTYAVAGTGGSANAIVVSHTHTATTSIAGATTGVYLDNTQIVDTGGGLFPQGEQPPLYWFVNGYTAPTVVDPGHTHSASTSVASAGSSATNANLPPYYALAYIMKS